MALSALNTQLLATYLYYCHFPLRNLNYYSCTISLWTGSETALPNLRLYSMFLLSQWQCSGNLDDSEQTELSKYTTLRIIVLGRLNQGRNGKHCWTYRTIGNRPEWDLQTRSTLVNKRRHSYRVPQQCTFTTKTACMQREHLSWSGTR